MVRQDKSKGSRVTEKASTRSESSSSESSDGSSPRRKVSREPVKVAGPSPLIIPILMFGLWGIGALIILANYTVPEDTLGMPANRYLFIGLGFILLGFIPATRFR